MVMPLPLPTFTTDDLRSFPEDGQRYELLEGVLLVTPAPGSAHQVVLGRLLVAVHSYLENAGRAYAVSPGEIEIAPKTLLDPDLLVFPATYAPGTAWRKISGWWLAAEVFSPSSRMYDRAYKRDAYLSLGVREVWLVDLDERAVFVSRRGEAERDVRHDRELRWTPEELREPLAIDLASLFSGLP
jgi:Uma2 family endonuclease